MPKKTTKGQATVDALAAWDEWKAVCSILGCSEASRRILAKRVSGVFNRLIGEVSGYSVKVPVSTVAERERVAGEFDSGLVERDRAAASEGSRFTVKKAYKDWIWERIASGGNGNPPIQCIEGLLFGQKGLIDRVVKRWLKSHYVIRVRKDSQGRRRFVFSKSLDERIVGTDDESCPIVDTLPDRRAPSPFGCYREKDDSTAVAEWIGKMAFPYAEAVVLLANLCAISVDSDEVKAAMRLGKSAIATRQQKALARFRVSFAGDDAGRIVREIACETPAAFRRQLITHLLGLIRNEPDAAALLKFIESSEGLGTK